MSAGRTTQAILAAATALLMLLLLSVVALGEVYAFILVGDGKHDVLGFSPDRRSFYNGASSIDNALKSGWGIAPQNIAFVQAWEHSNTDVLVRLKTLTSEVGENDVFIFYYVGHGSSTGEMTPWVGPSSGGGLLDFSNLADNYLQPVKGEKVVVLDCCYAGTARDDLDDDTWLLASCGNEEQRGVLYESYFSTALATAINNGATGVREAYNDAVDVLAVRALAGAVSPAIPPTVNPADLPGFLAALAIAAATPSLYSPTGVASDEDLDVAEAARAAPEITSLAVSGSITDVTGASASGAAAGSASCNVTLEIDSVSGEYRAICDYSVQADPARGRGSARVSIRIVVPILPPLGSIELNASMDAEGAVQYGVFPNAQSDYAPGTMQGDIVIGGVRASFTGSGQMQGQTSGTSAQDVEVTLWFDMEADL